LWFLTGRLWFFGAQAIAAEQAGDEAIFPKWFRSGHSWVGPGNDIIAEQAKEAAEKDFAAAKANK